MIPIIENFLSVERVGFIKNWRILVNRLIKDSRFYFPYIILTGLLFLILTGGLEGTELAVYSTIIVAFIRLFLKMLEPLKPETFHWTWENVKEGIEIVDAAIDIINTPTNNQ